MKHFGNLIIGISCMALLACVHKSKPVSTIKPQAYTCPMHAQIVRTAPQRCPICSMDLVPVNAGDHTLALTLSESQMILANVTVQPIGVQTIGNSIRLNARVAVDETNTQVISTRIAGRLDKLLVKQTGVPIHNGQVIYEIYSEQLAAYQHEYLHALDAALHNSKPGTSYAQAARKKLVLYGMTTPQVDALAATKVVNPLVRYTAQTSGVVAAIMVTEGQYVAEGGAVFKIENLDNVWVEADVYPHDAPFIHIGDSVTVQVTGLDRKPVQGVVTFMAPAYSAASQRLTLRAALHNAGHHFMPGMEAEVVVQLSRKRALTLPADAVVRGEHGSYVFKKIGVRKFMPQSVTTGVANVSQVAITEGLQPGDSIAVTGAYLLYSELVLKRGADPLAAHPERSKQAARMAAIQRPVQLPAQAALVPLSFRTQLKGVLASYFDVKNALVVADMHGVAMHVTKLNKALHAVDAGVASAQDALNWQVYFNQLQAAVRVMVNAQDLETQRASFATLTVTLYAALKTFAVTGTHAYYQFCPMAFDGKGAYWISDAKEIRNPYYGQKMLTCGETKETLQ